MVNYRGSIRHFSVFENHFIPTYTYIKRQLNRQGTTALWQQPAATTPVTELHLSQTTFSVDGTVYTSNNTVAKEIYTTEEYIHTTVLLQSNAEGHKNLWPLVTQKSQKLHLRYTYT